MSPHYVAFFKKKNPCHLCGAKKPVEKAPGRSLCPGHLAKARLGWRIWALDRRNDGLCLYCDQAGDLEPSGHRNCRCAPHREQNRVKCKAWAAANPGYNAKAYEKRKALLISGICVCPMHNPLPPGQRRCNACRSYSKAMKSGDSKTLRRRQEERRQARLKLAKQRAREAARLLRQQNR